MLSASSTRFWQLTQHDGLKVGKAGKTFDVFQSPKADPRSYLSATVICVKWFF